MRTRNSSIRSFTLYVVPGGGFLNEKFIFNSLSSIHENPCSSRDDYLLLGFRYCHTGSCFWFLVLFSDEYKTLRRSRVVLGSDAGRGGEYNSDKNNSLGVTISIGDRRRNRVYKISNNENDDGVLGTRSLYNIYIYM